MEVMKFNLDTYSFPVGKYNELCIIDANDLELIEDRVWCVHPRGFICHADNMLMHRLIKGVFDRKLMVFHANGNRWDNRSENLIIMTRLEFSRKKEVVLRLINDSGDPVGIRRVEHYSKGIKYANWVASYSGVSKSFSINRYGEQGAAQRAIAWRITQVKKMGLRISNPSVKPTGLGKKLLEAY